MPRTGGTLGLFLPMRRLPWHAGQLRAPIWQGLRLATLPGPENQGSQKWGLRVRVPPLSPAVRSHGTFSFFLSLYTRAGQSRSGHTAASSIGRAPGSDPGEVGSIPAAAASRAMRRDFFSLFVPDGMGAWEFPPGPPLPRPGKTSREAVVHLFPVLFPYLAGRRGSSLRLGPFAAVRANGSSPAWNAGAP